MIILDKKTADLDIVGNS